MIGKIWTETDLVSRGSDSQLRKNTYLSELVPDKQGITQKVVDTKIVVLKTRFDANTVKRQAEKSKQDFFAKRGLFKTKAEEIQLIEHEKYYEPYIVIGGKYSLDYCRNVAFEIKVERQTQKIFFAGRESGLVVPESGDKKEYVINLKGEADAHYEKETFFVLDRLRREISPKNFYFAPYEVQLEGAANDNLDLKVRISKDEIIELFRNKTAERPSNLARIKRELFDISENTIVCRPFFELTFHNTKTNQYVALYVDGVSGEQSLHKLDASRPSLFRGNLDLDNIASFSNTEAQLFPAGSGQPVDRQSFNVLEPDLPEPYKNYERQPEDVGAFDEKAILSFPAKSAGEFFTVGDNVTAFVGDLEIPSGSTVNDTIVVKGNLKIGDNCRLLRRVKALGDITVGFNTVIDGDIVSGGNVSIAYNSMVRGCVKAAGTIKMIGEKVEGGHEFNPKANLPPEFFDLHMIIDNEKE